MIEKQDDTKQQTSQEFFSELVEISLPAGDKLENTVVKGTVTDISSGSVLIDFGFKSEGRVPLNEFDGEEKPAVGDEVDVYVTLVENTKGECVLSRIRARRAEVWCELENCFRNRSPISGRILNQVKGGFTVGIKGVNVFLPGSQVGGTTVENTADLIGKEQEFRIIRFNMAKGNAVVSARPVETHIGAEKRSEMLANLKEGDVVQGVVKNITNYGAFIDLGFIDALLHVTDISWKRTQHPEDVLKVGQKLSLRVIKLNPEKGHINLSLKQMEVDPWSEIESKYQIGKVIQGKITNITTYGIFVELESGIEGLVHISKASWNPRHAPLNELFTLGQEVEAAILSVSTEKRRIALDMKQVLPNPWEGFAKDHKVGQDIEGKIVRIGNKSIFFELSDELEARLMLDTEEAEAESKNHEVGETTSLIIKEIKPEKGLIVLDFKSKTPDPLKNYSLADMSGKVFTCVVTGVLKTGIKVMLPDEVPGFIPTNQLSSTRSERYPDRFSVKDKVDAGVIGIDLKGRHVKMSIRVVEEQQRKKAIETYGSSTSGALLGDILGVALSKQKEKLQQTDDEQPEAKADETDQE